MFVQPETMSTILSRPSRATRRQRRASPASASSCAPPPGPGEVSPPRGVAARPARPRSDQRRTCDILCFSWTPHRGPSSELSSDAGLAARQLGFLIHPHHLSALRNEHTSPDFACSTDRPHLPFALVLTPRLGLAADNEQLPGGALHEDSRPPRAARTRADRAMDRMSNRHHDPCPPA